MSERFINFVTNICADQFHDKADKPHNTRSDGDGGSDVGGGEGVGVQ